MMHYCLHGASPCTGNLGVSALCCAVLEGIYQRLPDAQPTVFDYGKGIRSQRLFARDGQVGLQVSLAGLNHSRRFYRSDCLTSMRWLSHIAPRLNPILRRIQQADAILDISGGDSFTDLYGAFRLEVMTAPKELALRLGKPLILLPQTYGPFESSAARRRAERIVRRATLAYARDQRSYEQLRELCGDDFDAERHRCGVDVAFALPAVQPTDGQLSELQPWLEDNRSPLIGINVSGLIYNDPVAAVERYGFRADYRQVIHRLVSRLLEEADARVVLMPHVITRDPQSPESDPRACRVVADALVATFGDERLRIAPSFDDPRHAKWLISQFDWLCGTRMHATIAGLSSHVPTAAIAYSPKTKGVFETCGQGDQVVDPRVDDSHAVVEQLLDSFRQYAATRDSLPQSIAQVLKVAERQLTHVAASVAQGSECVR